MSSAAMASSSVSQEDVENDYERWSRRSRIRVARGRDVRGHQTAAASRPAGEPVAEHEDGTEPRPLDASGHCCDHDASPKPAVRAKDKRPARPTHASKGKQQHRDRRKLREKRRSTGVVHMPSTEVSSTGGSTNDDDEEQALQGMSAETRRNTEQNEFIDPVADVTSRQHQKPLSNRSQSDLDADDEENQDGDARVRSGAPAQKLRSNGQVAASQQQQAVEEENRRLQQALQDRDQRIAALEAALARSRQEKQHLTQENDALIRAMEALGTK